MRQEAIPVLEDAATIPNSAVSCKLLRCSDIIHGYTASSKENYAKAASLAEKRVYLSIFDVFSQKPFCSFKRDVDNEERRLNLDQAEKATCWQRNRHVSIGLLKRLQGVCKFRLK